MKLYEILSKLLLEQRFSFGIINKIIDHIEQIAKLRKPQIFAIKVYLYLRYELNVKSFEDLIRKLQIKRGGVILNGYKTTKFYTN